MQVILLRDVAKLGKRFSVVNVPDGFALNMLIPKGLAELATPENLKKVSARADKHSQISASTEAIFLETCELLKNKTINLTAVANDQGHLFKAVKVEDIVLALKENNISTLTEEMISLNESIKSLGEFSIPLKYHKMSGILNLLIVKK